MTECKQNVEHMYHPLFALYTTDQDIPAGKSFLQFIFFKHIFLLVCTFALKYFSLFSISACSVKTLCVFVYVCARACVCVYMQARTCVFKMPQREDDFLL